MATPTLREKLRQFFNQFLPTQVITRYDTRTLPAALAHTLTVDTVLDIFRAAEGGDTERLFALYRDILLANTHLQSQFGTRKLAVLGDVLSIKPFRKTDPDDAQVAELLAPIKTEPFWLEACNHLLDATLWPVAVVEKVYQPSTTDGLTYELAKLVPVPHALLDFRNGRLQIRDVDENGRPLSTLHDPDPRRYIVHRGHLLTTPDNWGGPMRSLVFWWLLATMDREWWARFLDRYGAPFVVGKYPSGDDDSRGVLQRAFALATKLGGLVVSTDTDVEIKQAAATDAGDAFEKFHSICNREISKLILGQTITADAQSTGLGSGVANAQEGVRQDIRQWDALKLGATFTSQLATQLVEINGLKGKPCLFVWGTVSPAELKAMGDFLTSLRSSGLRVADDGIEILSERAGLPLERDNSAPAAFSPLQPFTPAHAVTQATIASDANMAIVRDAAARLAPIMRRRYAPIVQLIATSKSPADALGRVEAYCARLDPADAADVTEKALMALAANGAAVHAK